MAERLRTQDNLSTANPIWHVQVKGQMGQWVTVMVAMTRKGADDYLERDGHNLKKPRIFVESLYRCQEMIALREWLISLSPNADEVGNK